jgi:DNA-binding NarL/FixJ family response regulator
MSDAVRKLNVDNRLAANIHTNRHTMNRTTLLLADDHEILLDGLADLLREDFNVVGTAPDGRRLIEMAREKRPEVIVTDIGMPSVNGIDAMRILKEEGLDAKFLFVTMHSELRLVEEAFRLGASGFLLKLADAAEFIAAIRSVAKGARYVSPILGGDLVSSFLKHGSSQTSAETFSDVQRKVLQLLSEGKTMREAATILGISKRTAEFHKYDAMRKLGVRTNAALIRYASRLKPV